MIPIPVAISDTSGYFNYLGTVLRSSLRSLFSSLPDSVDIEADAEMLSSPDISDSEWPPQPRAECEREPPRPGPLLPLISPPLGPQLTLLLYTEVDPQGSFDLPSLDRVPRPPRPPPIFSGRLTTSKLSDFLTVGSVLSTNNAFCEDCNG